MGSSVFFQSFHGKKEECKEGHSLVTERNSHIAHNHAVIANNRQSVQQSSCSALQEDGASSTLCFGEGSC